MSILCSKSILLKLSIWDPDSELYISVLFSRIKASASPHLPFNRQSQLFVGDTKSQFLSLTLQAKPGMYYLKGANPIRRPYKSPFVSEPIKLINQLHQGMRGINI